MRVLVMIVPPVNILTYDLDIGLRARGWAC
jgi:hypothetical protein